MADERFLVTGALGCLGAWVVRALVRDGVSVTVLDLSRDPRRLRLIMSADEVARVHFAAGDIADLDFVEGAVRDCAATHVIHLAALQVPFCRADPPLGARVNVVGTCNVFEAARRAALRRVVYASSVAVYGPGDDYPESIVGHEAKHRPQTHYGVFKEANEGNARIYWVDSGISSIGLRPHTIYGPGRDQGMTSSPTKAMLAAAAGRPYHIPYGGRTGMQYAPDVADIFLRVARIPFDGAEVFNIRGEVVDMSEIVAAIESCAPEARGRITIDRRRLPFPEGQDDGPLQALLGSLPRTPLADGVAASVRVFRQALADGRLSADVD